MLGPPGGSVGNLMVGAAEGLGGKVMRTVSFLGSTLESDCLGGSAPPGKLGMLSAINLFQFKLKSRWPGVKFLMTGKWTGPRGGLQSMTGAGERCESMTSATVFRTLLKLKGLAIWGLPVDLRKSKVSSFTTSPVRNMTRRAWAGFFCATNS